MHTNIHKNAHEYGTKICTRIHTHTHTHTQGKDEKVVKHAQLSGTVEKSPLSAVKVCLTHIDTHINTHVDTHTHSLTHTHTHTHTHTLCGVYVKLCQDTSVWLVCVCQDKPKVDSVCQVMSRFPIVWCLCQVMSTYARMVCAKMCQHLSICGVCVSRYVSVWCVCQDVSVCDVCVSSL